MDAHALPEGYLDAFLAYREIEGGRFVGIVPLTFGRARIVLGHTSDPYYADMW